MSDAITISAESETTAIQEIVSHFDREDKKHGQRLLGWHIQRLRAADEARIAELLSTQAVCHCGDLLIHHGIGSGHSPVPLSELCPYAEDLQAMRADNAQLTADLAAANKRAEKAEAERDAMEILAFETRAKLTTDGVGVKWSTLYNDVQGLRYKAEEERDQARQQLEQARAAMAVKDAALRFYANIENFQITVWADQTKDVDCWTEPAKDHGLTEKGNQDFGIVAEEALASTGEDATAKEEAQP